MVLDDDQTFVRVGAALLPVMPPLDRVLRGLPWRRPVGPSGKVAAASEWLFPGRQAGLHLEAEYIRSRLGALEIGCRPARNAALLQLAGPLPAAVVADKVGIDPTAAEPLGHSWPAASGPATPPEGHDLRQPSQGGQPGRARAS